MWIYNLVSIKVAISMLNFKVYWSTLGTYFLLVRASTCLVFCIGSSKSFWKVSCGNSVSLVPKIKTTRFQVLIWGELVLYKTPLPGDSHQPDMLGLDAGFPAAPVRSLQWLNHLHPSFFIFWSVLHMEGQSRRPHGHSGKGKSKHHHHKKNKKKRRT